MRPNCPPPSTPKVATPGGIGEIGPEVGAGEGINGNDNDDDND